MRPQIWSRGLIAVWMGNAALFLIGVVLLYPPKSYSGGEGQQYSYEGQSAYHVALGSLGQLGKFLEDHNGAVTAGATVVIMLFTITLWWSTHKLGRLSQDQMRVLEQAYLAVGPTNIFTDPFIGTVGVELMVHNVGRTPGFVRRVYTEFSLTPPAGRIPTYSNGETHDTDLAYAAGAESKLPLRSQTNVLAPHYFWGYVDFQDIFFQPHRARFCTRLIPMVGEAGRYEIAGTPEWSAFD